MLVANSHYPIVVDKEWLLTRAQGRYMYAFMLSGCYRQLKKIIPVALSTEQRK